MHNYEAGTFGPGDPRPIRSRTSLVAIGAAGAILVLGAGGCYFLTQAGPAALAATSRVLISGGLLGLLLVGSVLTVYLAVTSGRQGGGHGGGGRRPPEPVPAPPMIDLDAELLRILDDSRLGAIPVARRAQARSGRS